MRSGDFLLTLNTSTNQVEWGQVCNVDHGGLTERVCTVSVWEECPFIYDDTLDNTAQLISFSQQEASCVHEVFSKNIQCILMHMHNLVPSNEECYFQKAEIDQAHAFSRHVRSGLASSTFKVDLDAYLRGDSTDMGVPVSATSLPTPTTSSSNASPVQSVATTTSPSASAMVTAVSAKLRVDHRQLPYQPQHVANDKAGSFYTAVKLALYVESKATHDIAEEICCGADSAQDVKAACLPE